jgi:hypothetical protein
MKSTDYCLWVWRHIVWYRTARVALQNNLYIHQRDTQYLTGIFQNFGYPTKNSGYFYRHQIFVATKYSIIRTSVSIAMGYWLDGRGLIIGRGKRFFSTPQRPDRLWSPPSLLSNGYWWWFPPG